jgi:hypothetical protein
MASFRQFINYFWIFEQTEEIQGGVIIQNGVENLKKY